MSVNYSWPAPDGSTNNNASNSKPYPQEPLGKPEYSAPSGGYGSYNSNQSYETPRYAAPIYAAPAPQGNAYVNQTAPNILIRALWFLFIGLWLGGIWLSVGYFLCLTIIGLPFGLWMLNRTPMVMTLKPFSNQTYYQQDAYGNVYAAPGRPQLPFIARALWFLFIGWWATAVWISVAYVMCALIITLPIAAWMFNRIPEVLTLRMN
jgi:uncharacterized membrane protein YccF (DUF307 family)